jgi:DNA ligase D-like protein (predicted 3'-phosphoesterase)
MRFHFEKPRGFLSKPFAFFALCRKQSAYSIFPKIFTIALQLLTCENMPATPTGRFVVHKHQATRLHYDFRLELDAVLKSWAIPKEPPTQPGIKRLAVQVEDHLLSYIDFEGTIPKGEYGGGTVEIWDKGTYALKNRSENKIVFTLHGEKLAGDYILVRLKQDKNWLFFRKKQP